MKDDVICKKYNIQCLMHIHKHAFPCDFKRYRLKLDSIQWRVPALGEVARFGKNAGLYHLRAASCTGLWCHVDAAQVVQEMSIKCGTIFHPFLLSSRLGERARLSDLRAVCAFCSIVHSLFSMYLLQLSTFKLYTTSQYIDK